MNRRQLFLGALSIPFVARVEGWPPPCPDLPDAAIEPLDAQPQVWIYRRDPVSLPADRVLRWEFVLTQIATCPRSIEMTEPIRVVLMNRYTAPIAVS
jgi:hypothetical protein